MKSNLGTIDKVIRILAAAAAIILFFTHVISGTLGIVILAAGVVLGLTAVISFCPIYHVLGLSTRPKGKPVESK
jgi:hypothetical protein